MRVAAVAVAIVGLLLSGCALASAPTDVPVTSGVPAESPTRPVDATPSHPEVPRPTIRSCARALVDRLSLAEQVGQLFMMGVYSARDWEVGLLRRHHVGAGILLGSSTAGVLTTAAKVRQVKQAGGRLPILIAVDQEGGIVQRLQGPGFERIPSAADQAAWPDDELRARATVWGQQLKSAGVDLNLAPVADVVPAGLADVNAPIGRLRRGFGSDPDVVAAKAGAFIAGMRAAGVATTVKHFPGIGQVRGNTDFTTGVTDTVTSADDPLLLPFAQAVRDGVDAVMVSTVRYERIDPDSLAVFSPTVISLVRVKFSFDGVIISDDLGAAASVRSVPAEERGRRFVAAGGDLVINATPSLMGRMIDGVLDAARKDARLRQRIPEAATRVVTLKISLGLAHC